MCLWPWKYFTRIPAINLTHADVMSSIFVCNSIRFDSIWLDLFSAIELRHGRTSGNFWTEAHENHFIYNASMWLHRQKGQQHQKKNQLQPFKRWSITKKSSSNNSNSQPVRSNDIRILLPTFDVHCFKFIKWKAIKWITFNQCWFCARSIFIWKAMFGTMYAIHCRSTRLHLSFHCCYMRD